MHYLASLELEKENFSTTNASSIIYREYEIKNKGNKEMKKKT
jgi:hypothetical protein